MPSRFGLAVARLAPQSIFARKNYFYPDLPKATRSPVETPVVSVPAFRSSRQRAPRDADGPPSEEDSGKSLHEGAGALASVLSGIDLNRPSAVLEIVTEPYVRSPSGG